MKLFIRAIGAILLIAGAIGVGLLMEFYVYPKVDTVEVVIAKETIDFKKPITADNIEIINVRKGQKIENAIPVTHYKSLIGKYASIKIEKGTQIYSDLIDTYNLVPDSTKGEFVAPIPKDWLFAVPGSLRRTYVADIYAMGDKEREMLRQLQADAKRESGEKVEDTPQELNVTPSTAPILENVRVTSVKDNSNKEVRESEETKEATGQVSELEVIATDEMLSTIKEYTAAGYKLYVVYKFERADITEVTVETGEEDAE